MDGPRECRHLTHLSVHGVDVTLVVGKLQAFRYAETAALTRLTGLHRLDDTCLSACPDNGLYWAVCTGRCLYAAQKADVISRFILEWGAQLLVLITLPRLRPYAFSNSSPSVVPDLRSIRRIVEYVPSTSTGHTNEACEGTVPSDCSSLIPSGFRFIPFGIYIVSFSCRLGLDILHFLRTILT